MATFTVRLQQIISFMVSDNGWYIKTFITPEIILCVFFFTVYNMAQAQRISNREFKLWKFLQRTESRVATFLAETCVMPHQSLFLSHQAKSKCKLPTAVEFGSRTPKSDHGSSENV